MVGATGAASLRRMLDGAVTIFQEHSAVSSLEEYLRTACTSGDRRDLVGALSQIDMVFEYGGRDEDLNAIVDLLFGLLANPGTDPELVGEVLDGLRGTTNHPDFEAIDLSRLVGFMQRTERADWVADGLDILASSYDPQHKPFISTWVDHPEPGVASSAVYALQEIDAALQVRTQKSR